MDKQPKNKNKSVIEPDIIIHKVVWTPPDIKFKEKKGTVKKPNVKCVYCGKEYFKSNAKSNLKVCKKCIEINEYRQAPASTQFSSGGNKTAIGSDLTKEKNIPKSLKEKQKVITRKPGEMDLFSDYDAEKDHKTAQNKQDIINNKKQETINEVNRIILGLLPETPKKSIKPG